MEKSSSLTSSHLPVDAKRAGLRNENLILTLLQKNDALSQAQICQFTSLNSSTISYIVGRLREKNLIIEQRGQSNKRGAKPVMLSLNPLGKFAVGVEINPSYIFVGLFNFKCELIECIRTINLDHSPSKVTNLIEINLRGLLSKHQIQWHRLTGIGITLSGSISETGTVKLSSPLGWRDIHLKELLQETLETPVSIFTSRVRLLAELDSKPPLHSRNILYLNAANGVGSSVIIDGRLSHGATNRSGELGHIIFDPKGPHCGCGHRGCLETLVSGPALAQRIKSDIKNGTHTNLRKSIKTENIAEDIITKWGHAIKEKDPYALELCDFVCEQLSRAAAIAINCYDPDILILAGYVCQTSMAPLTKAIRSRITTDVYDNQSRKIKIIPARAGDQALIRGAANALLHQSSSLSDLL
jgi:N-acetylglucosamine repressor